MNPSVAQAKRNSQFWSLTEVFNLSEAIGALAQDVANGVCGELAGDPPVSALLRAALEGCS